MMKRLKQIWRLTILLSLGAAISQADTLELKNGSLIKGRFVGGTETEIKFQVGSSVQRYNVADIVSLKFDSEGAAGNLPGARNQASEAPPSVTIPAGTQLSVRTIDSLDSTKNHVGDRFQATLEEPLVVDGNVVVAVYFKAIGFIRVSLAATRGGRIVGLHQGLIPLAYRRIRVLPLPKVTGTGHAH